MPKIVKPLKIAIDLKSITNKKILDTDKNLLKHYTSKGALGSIEVLSEVFDLYLISKYSSIDYDEILRWLKAGAIDKCFRKIIIISEDKPLQDFILHTGINVTIATDSELVNDAKHASTTYWLSRVHIKDIQTGILKVNDWYEALKDIIKYSMTDNYDFRYTKKKRK